MEENIVKFEDKLKELVALAKRELQSLQKLHISIE